MNQALSILLGSALAVVVYLVGSLIVRRMRSRVSGDGVRRQYTSTGWPIVTPEEIRETDKILREVSGMDEEEKRRERLAESRRARASGQK